MANLRSFFLPSLGCQLVDFKLSRWGGPTGGPLPLPDVASRQAVAIIPFALKPLVALLSDAFPIAGYHKLPYVVGALDPG